MSHTSQTIMVFVCRYRRAFLSVYQLLLIVSKKKNRFSSIYMSYASSLRTKCPCRSFLLFNKKRKQPSSSLIDQYTDRRISFAPALDLIEILYNLERITITWQWLVSWSLSEDNFPSSFTCCFCFLDIICKEKDVTGVISPKGQSNILIRSCFNLRLLN